MKIEEINRTSTIAWSPDVIPLLATGSVAGAVDLDFSSSSTLEIWDVFGSSPGRPIFSANVENKFHALAWSSPFEGHPRGVLTGALENGTVQFWDVDTLIRTMSLTDASVHTSTKHSGAVKCLSFNPHQPHVLATGGQHSELFIWDLKTFSEPISPGRPTTPMDEISSISWNNAVSHILASTSNAGYTSIWDLKAKREVLHLAYTGALGRADFSHVAWHPTQSTKLITASQSDACPLIMSWDLRNATEPEKILQGHTKGVLSLDWCAQDPNLLISSGKDNSTRLWNPITGVKLGDYPSAANWAFLTRFAPRAPDVIATASFDGKVVVQTLQETSSPASEKAATKNDDDFWSAIASTETQSAVFEVSQAPEWLKRPCSASFGFGSKLLVVRNESGKGSVQISKLDSGNKDHQFSKDLSAAIKSNDFKGILASKLENPPADSADWEVLSELEKSGKNHFLQAIIGDSKVLEDAEPVPEPTNNNIGAVDDEEESFFANLSKDIQIQKDLDQLPPFVPSGDFTIIDQSQSSGDTRLAKLLLSNKIGQAVSVCLEEGKLLEALVLSMDEDEKTKRKVKSYFFEQTKSDVLSRLIYSASSKDIVDIVANADISNWREIAASIAAYCTEETDFNSKTVELGDRIMASGSADKENRKNALLCYLAGNALDKVAAIWLTELPELEHSILTSESAKISSPHDARYLALAGFVEKISVYRSLSNLTGPLSGPSIEPVCKAVFDFSNMAASNGEFELANQFLGLLPDDFAGLKTEKERIAKATGATTDVSGKIVANGASKTQHRYTKSRTGSNIPPTQFPALQPLGKPASIGRAVPPMSSVPPKPSLVTTQSQGYIPAAAPTFTAPSNPYVPAGDEKRGSFGEPLFPPRNNSVGISPNPVAQVAHTGPIRPPSTPAFTQTLQQTQPYGAGAQAAVPPPGPNPTAKYKSETEGWNDLPETFKASKPSSRRAPAPVAIVVPSPSLSAVQISQPQPPKRPQASHAIAPPPKIGSRSVSKSSAPGTPTITSSPKPSKYAPPVPSSPALQPNGFGNGGPSPVQPPKATGPPKNPYAPAVVAPTKTTYATPPVNNFVSPPNQGVSRTASQIVNPYSPAARAGSRNASSGSLSGPTSQGIVPPTPRVPSISSRQTPTQQSEAQFAPPPKIGSGRYTSPHVTQSNGFGHVAPPPVPVATNVVPPPMPASKPVVPTPPVSAAKPVPPPSVSASNYAPPPVSAPKPVVPPPVPVAKPVPQPPVPAGNYAPPPMSSISHGQPPAVAPPAPSAVQPAPQKAVNGQAVSGDFIKSSFGTILGQIKPAAPPKYAKHVLDMEKRLGILFEHLNKQTLLTAPTIELLDGVAKSLNEKDYPRATALNQQIGQDFPTEAGTWHTGVKRLVTMAEAFEI
ncbi:hypothetical protein JCM33374_g6565 [Metschnikowia sp. JCM 33374]|nr:hypothetical protein JCM33374_g6565 [Metschnikowia sp. JCM 33374]